jgi:SAM-dependent methyltransferase
MTGAKHEKSVAYEPGHYDALSTGIPGDVAFYLRLARQAMPPVLELGCGTGRIAVPLARAGIQLVGLDSSRPMLLAAANKAPGLSNLRWLQGDMRRLPLTGPFGLIIIPYRGFQHLLTRIEQISTLEAVLHLLAPGGRLAMDVFNPAAIDLLALAMGGRLAHPGKRSGQSEGATSDGLLSRTQTDIKLRFTDREHLEELLSEAGFQIDTLYGDFDGTAFNERCTAMVWIARRFPASSA